MTLLQMLRRHNITIMRYKVAQSCATFPDPGEDNCQRTRPKQGAN
jgi:hypothetical protein